MKNIYFVDQTLRDAHQSLWATRMPTSMMVPIAPVIDEVGYKYVVAASAPQMDACVRYLRENPWERLRLLVKAMPKTPLQGNIMNTNFLTFKLSPYSIMELFIKVLAENGIKRGWSLDALCDWSNERNQTIIPMWKKLGLELDLPIPYAISPVHTDQYYAQKAAEAVKLFKPNSIVLKDSMGLLTPERTKTLVPALKKAIGKTPLEMHCHCNTGLAPLCHIEGMKLGVDTFHTVTLPLANGASHPSVENTVRNARLLGFNPNINDKAAQIVASHFTYAAKRDGKPLGVPVEYSVFDHLYNMAGGTVSNLRFMLKQRGMEDRWNEVVEEICRIDQEWGYFPNITPFSQIMNTQAVLNITLGERYAVAPEETITYLLGYYGKPPGPVDQNVVDRVSSLPEAKPFLNWEPPQPSIQDIRREYGHPGISDEELLLRYTIPQEHVEAMLAVGPYKDRFTRGDKPTIALIQELTMRKDTTYVHIEREGFSFTLKKT